MVSMYYLITGYTKESFKKAVEEKKMLCLNTREWSLARQSLCGDLGNSCDCYARALCDDNGKILFAYKNFNPMEIYKIIYTGKVFENLKTAVDKLLSSLGLKNVGDVVLEERHGEIWVYSADKTKVYINDLVSGVYDKSIFESVEYCIYELIKTFGDRVKKFVFNSDGNLKDIYYCNSIIEKGSIEVYFNEF